MSDKDSRNLEAYRSLERFICTKRREHERFIELAEEEIRAHPNADTSELTAAIADARQKLEKLETDRENCVLIRWARKNGCETRAYGELKSRRGEVRSQLDGDFFDQHVHGGDKRHGARPVTSTVRAAVRADPKPAQKYLIGYATVYNQWTEIGGYFDEIIKPGAFREVLLDADLDCACLGNHDPNLSYGRTSGKTLRLSEDGHGLFFQCLLNLDDTDARNAALRVADGTWCGCSISFMVGEDDWDYSSTIPKRTITKAGKLYDVSPVTFPAYTGTSVAITTGNARSQDDFIQAPKPDAPTMSLRERVDSTYERLRPYLKVAASAD